MRENIAEICWNNEHFKNFGRWEEAKQHNQGDIQRAYESADQILTLFRQRIERMQVLCPEQIEYWRFQAGVSKGYGASDWAVGNLAKKIAQAQLSKCREDALKELG